MSRWRELLGKRSGEQEKDRSGSGSTSDPEASHSRLPRWKLGMLQDKETDEVPGSVLLMSNVAGRNHPLGLQHVRSRRSSSSLPSPYLTRSQTPGSSRRRSPNLKPTRKKLTADGKIILDPQPDDSLNDPLNWPAFRRDLALLTLGLYCMIGGGMTTILAAGFTNVASTFNISTARVSLTTGLYMMGLGIGGVIASPTAILFGKRPVYLVGAILFTISAIWCAVSPNFTSLVFARIFQGIAVSPVECLPSATVAEIYFLHERAYRLGIYTLLLLGGKNLVPLVSAAIINSLGWRWVFWILAMIVGFYFVLIFLFIPETFWDRTPRPRRFLRHDETHSESKRSLSRRFRRSSARGRDPASRDQDDTTSPAKEAAPASQLARHVNFADGTSASADQDLWARRHDIPFPDRDGRGDLTVPGIEIHDEAWKVVPSGQAPPTPQLRNLNSPFYEHKSNDGEGDDYFAIKVPPPTDEQAPSEQGSVLPASEPEASGHSSEVVRDEPQLQLPSSPLSKAKPPPLKLTLPPRALIQQPVPSSTPAAQDSAQLFTGVIPSPTSEVASEKASSLRDVESAGNASSSSQTLPQSPMSYTTYHREASPKTYVETLKPYAGRLSKDNWFKVALRPFILYAYPSILWSAMVYSLSVGWLIVLSESVTVIYRNRDTYNFTALQTGLVYLSPFVGGILGTAVAGKISDIMVRAISKRNDGVYEPEFRLLMAAPVAVTTVMGLMGFGWSAQERDMWFVPTFFFGVISFGCTLGSTTAITFAVDCYRGYAGEALVTLNFAKNIFHGLVFSLFFTSWLESDGAKDVFLVIGGIQLACLLFTIPMYIYGKRARMWTYRKNLMERF